MKKILALLLLIGSSCLAQKTIPDSFTLKNVPSGDSEAFYKEAIEQANLESFRLESEDLTLYFENGMECVMHSAKSLFVKGMNINPKSYQETINKSYLPLFKVMPDKRIAAIARKPIENKQSSQ